VLEGSVRRSAHTVRVTAQLINAMTGFHLWSQSYDRNLGDMLKLQSEISDAVASALKVTLLGNVAERIELGGTHNPAAFDAYLRGTKAYSTVHDGRDEEAAISAYAEAIRLDASYALALAARSMARTDYGGYYSTGARQGGSFTGARTDAHHAIALAPELAEAHLALAYVLEVGYLDLTHAAPEYQRAMSLAPGNALVARTSGRFALFMGQTDAGLAAVRHAVQLDPLNPAAHRLLGSMLFWSHHDKEAIAAAEETLALDPAHPGALAVRGLAYYALGDYQKARASCEAGPRAGKGSDYHIQVCLALTYEKLGRHADAEAMVTAVKSWYGDAGAFQYTQIYAQWGDVPRALQWLETALRLRDAGLSALKIDPLMDPLREQPRYQAVERALKFPPQ
jgi:tetratricopeptide (TPR) repeat protein